jgi:hypothetical protein
MNLYDFDKTIYKCDSPSKFYFYCLRHHPKLWWHPLKVCFWGLVKSFKIINLSQFKEKFFTFILYLPDYKLDLHKFWEKELKNINPWYFELSQPDDVICSATPRFLMREVVPLINKSATLVCTDIDEKTIKFKKGEVNCKGENKATKLKNAGFTSFENGYGDAMSDIPMLKMCKNRYRVKNGEITTFDDKYFL